MAGTYTPIVVLEGQSKIASSIAGGAAINISHLAVGDGNGSTPVVVDTMTALVRELDRVTVTGAVRDNVDTTKVVVTATIPVSSGPYTIREIGVFTSDGKLFAIGAYPETFKPTAAQGATVAVDVEFVIQVSETAQVTITVDPANTVSIAGMVRVPFIAVDGHLVNTPPSTPTFGNTYTIGGTPTGAWAGNANKLAQWTGTLWAIAAAPERTLVGDKATGLYYRRTSTSWAELLASETDKGLIQLATAAEVLAGTDALKAVTPATLHSLQFGRPYLGFHGDGVSQSYAPGLRQVGSYTNLTNNLPGATVSAGIITIATPGFYAVCANLQSLMPDTTGSYGYALSVSRVNSSGVAIESIAAAPVLVSSVSVPSAQAGSASGIRRLIAGDKIATFLNHNLPSTNISATISLDIEFRGA